MDITRELLANTRWQTQDGKKIPITEMDDRHLANSIKMLVRIGETGSYSHCLLCAEQTFRKAEKNGQQSLDLPISAPVEPPEPPKSPLRILKIGRVGNRFDGLGEALDRIAMKHHGLTAAEMYDTLDDIDSFGYNGDGW